MNQPSLAEQALDRVFEITVLLADDMSQSLGSQGLTESRAHLLYVLESTGPSTQRTLADALEVAPRTITGLVDALVETGFVTREPHPADRRAHLVTLTAHGAEVAAGLVGGRTQLAADLFGEMDTARLDALVVGLDDTLVRLHTLIEEAR